MIPKPERRIALTFDADPDNARLAIDVLRALKADGYRVENIPADGKALLRALPAGPNDASDETFQRGDYGMFFATLPRLLQDSVTQRWGAPERDPAFRESRLDCGAFALPAIRCGGIVVATTPGRDDTPRHGTLAFYAWLADGFRAQAIVHLGATRDVDPALSTVPQFHVAGDAAIAGLLQSLDR
jgi:cobaltochelatase CobN